MHDDERIDAARAALERSCRGAVTRAAEDLAPLARDFGRLLARRPALVLRPSSGDDVVAALQVAAEHELPVTSRGAGHSQCGQGLGDGLVLDMRGLARVSPVAAGAPMVEAEAGASWRSVVDATFARGLIPAGLTLVLDTTLGGTLSVGGVGAQSWAVGPQVDQVAFVDVATAAGGIIRCSTGQNRDLFDAVRAGLGQCGIIVRVGYPLRPCGSNVRTYYLAYTDVEAFMTDVERVCADGRAHHVLGTVTLRDHPFDRWAMATQSAQAPRMLVLILGREHGGDGDAGQIDEGELLGGLRFSARLPPSDHPLWRADGVPGHVFFNVYVPPEGSLDADASTLHPWVDLVFARDVTARALAELLAPPPEQTGELFQNGIIFIRRGATPAPLLVAPAGGGSGDSSLIWGVGMFPSAPPTQRAPVVDWMTRYAERWLDRGGKHYLSCFVPHRTARDWSRHYGDAWPGFRQAKDRFDPAHRLNPGFITWRD